jgi:transcriptional regulator with GAF, ATPase, and Fis domain
MVDKKEQNRKAQQKETAGLFTEIPPSLVPRLGEYLLQKGLIKPDGLQRALSYQTAKSTPDNPIPLGQALLDLGLIDRDKLDRAILKQSLSLQSALEEANRTLEERVQQRTLDLEKRLIEIQTAAEITQLAITADSKQEMFKRVVDLLVARFHFYLVSIFLMDEGSQYAILVEAAGEASAGQAAEEIKKRGCRILVNSRSMVGFVAAENEIRVTTDVSEEFYYLADEFLPDTRSEASIPISNGESVWGVLDIQQSDVDGSLPDQPFSLEMLTVLQAIANHLAANMRNFRLLENTQARVQEETALFQASHLIAEASSTNEVLSAACQALNEALVPSIILMTDGNVMRVEAVGGGRGSPQSSSNLDPKEIRIQSTRQDFDELFADGSALLDFDFNQEVDFPACVLEVPSQLKWKTAAFIPVKRHGKIEVVFILGTQQVGSLNQSSLQSFAGLAELTSTALNKLSAQRIMEKRLDALQTLNSISQAVSIETDIDGLYQVVHREVNRLLGEVDFLIATYDPTKNTIKIPYMYESGSYLQYEPFPLGEGLTSVLINTRQPLLLVENTEKRAEELGAKVLGKPAKSWLGVPLLVAGEVIGALIVQDLEREMRFDEDDQRILSTLASQVAVAIRNTHLLENMNLQAERERQLFQITSKIRAASDMQAILETTATELSKALKARRAEIKIGLKDD